MYCYAIVYPRRQADRFEVTANKQTVSNRYFTRLRHRNEPQLLAAGSFVCESQHDLAVGAYVIFRYSLVGQVNMIKLAKSAAVVFSAILLSISGAFAASGNSADILSYIPADTPYVFASTDPLPSALADKLEPTIDGVLQSYQEILRYVIAEQAGKISAEEGGADKAEHFSGVAEEFLSLMSLEGIRGAGIDRNTAFALYGNGLLPVLRLELSKSELFDAAIEKIEKKADEPLLVGEAKGEKYKYIEADMLKVIIATLDEQAVITIVPNEFDESQVALALGVKTPANSMKKSKKLDAIGKEYGFSDYLIGYIDNERIAGIFTGNATDFDKELFAAFGEEAPELTQACSAEIMATVRIAPRIVMGYSDMTAQQVSGSLIVELRSDIAKGLATIPAAVPGLGSDPGGFMSFGLGLNPMALREFYAGRLDAMEADPYECKDFAELQAGVAKGREALNQPLPPVVYSFRGFFANIVDFEGIDMASDTDTMPTSIDASIVLAVENAEALIMLAAMMDPQIAALNLMADGKPVKLELAQLAEFVDDAFAAMSENALSVSVGAGAESNSAELLLADSADPAPFMSVSMDSARYYSMVGEAMSNAPPVDDEAEQMPEEIRSAMRDIMVLSGNMYDRMSIDMQFTDRGIEIGTLMKLSEQK